MQDCPPHKVILCDHYTRRRQNAYRKPNWICRAVVADVTLPNEDEVSVACGRLKFT